MIISVVKIAKKRYLYNPCIYPPPYAALARHKTYRQPEGSAIGRKSHHPEKT